MIRTHQLVSAFIFLIISLFFCACEIDDFYAVRDIETVRIRELDTGLIFTSADTSRSDSIALIVNPFIVSFTHHWVDYKDAPSAITTNGNTTMANEIINIEIFCDKDLYQIPAGENLSHVILFSSAGHRLLLDEFINLLPKKGASDFDFLDHFEVLFLTKPAPGAYTFRIVMEDNNHHLFSATFPTLTWL